MICKSSSSSRTARPIGTKSREVPNMTPGRAALVVLMHRYLSGLMDPFVTLLELHKLMYFMQEAGEPLRLKYIKPLRSLRRQSPACAERSRRASRVGVSPMVAMRQTSRLNWFRAR